MTPELKHKWIDALRSMEYEQGQSLLRSKMNKYCCLGVLYEIAGKTWKYNNGYYTGNNFTAILGTELCNELGLSYIHQDVLITMNDTGRSFHQIAAWVDKNVN